MKNPDNKPLRIVHTTSDTRCTGSDYPQTLAQLAIAQAMLVKAGKSSAMPHFIALVKEIEVYYRIKFEQIPEEDLHG